MTTWTSRAETDADIPAIRDIILRAFPTAAERTGAGSAATRAALASARAMGEKLVVVLGHAGYYPRFGFRPASGFGIRAPFDVPDEALMALPLDDSPAVPGGVIRYPAAFGV